MYIESIIKTLEPCLRAKVREYSEKDGTKHWHREKNIFPDEKSQLSCQKITSKVTKIGKIKSDLSV